MGAGKGKWYKLGHTGANRGNDEEEKKKSRRGVKNEPVNS